MNTAHARYFSRLYFSAAWPFWLLLMGLNALLVLGIAGLPALMHRAPLDSSALLALSALPALLLMATSVNAGNGLARALAVMTARAGPRRGVAGARRHVWRALLTAYLLCALPLPLLSVGSTEVWRFTAGPALLALAMLGGLAGGTLWWSSALPRIMLLLALLLPMLLLGRSTLLHAWPLQLAVLLTLPAATMALLPRSTQAGRRSLGDLLKQAMRRSASHFQGLAYRDPWRASVMAYASGAMFWNSDSWLGQPLLADWGVDQNWRWSLRLLLFIMMASAFLRCPGLHWRRLLAPGGLSRGRIGLDVLRHSLLSIGKLLLLLAPLALLAQGLFSGRGWAAVLAAAPGQWLPLLAELLLATTVAAIAAGALPRNPDGVIGIGLLVLLIFGLLMWNQPAWRAALHWPRGIAHLSACLLACLALLPVLRQAWRRTDLTRLAEQVKKRQRDLDGN